VVFIKILVNGILDCNGIAEKRLRKAAVLSSRAGKYRERDGTEKDKKHSRTGKETFRAWQNEKRDRDRPKKCRVSFRKGRRGSKNGMEVFGLE